MPDVRIVRRRWIAWLPLLAAIAGLASPARGQLIGGMSTTFELAGKVRVDEIDAEAQNHLGRVRALVANEQWADAVDALRQVMENHRGKVIAVTDRRYVSVRGYCHMLLASLPQPALDVYRRQVDAQAQQWFDEGVATHNAAMLHKVVDQLYCSSWGDDALLALGSLALEAGDYSAARHHWEQLVPSQAVAEGPPTVLRYPASDLVGAELLARLVLVSILEGSEQRATRELDRFADRYPDARGRLGGRDVNLAEELRSQLAAMTTWETPHPSSDWPTFAGQPDRNHVVDATIDLGALAWRIKLPKPPVPDVTFSRPIAEERDAPLSYHPIVVGDLLLVNDLDADRNQYEIRAYDLRTGRAAWANDPVMYTDPASGERMRTTRNILGVARFTMSAHGNRLYARVGNPITSGPNEPPVLAPTGFVVCIDLAAEGRLVWQTRQSMPLDDGWSFEGSPVCDGTNVYIGMRRSDVLPQYQVACLDAATGTLRWRRWIASAYTPAQGQMDEITHNLLTVDGGTVYCSTNVGAIAALDAADGQIRWITLYGRARGGDLSQRAAHFSRDLTPPVYDRGRLFVAPSDTSRIIALDAATGLLLWETDHPDDAIHVLGVGGDNLIVSGEKLWWIHTITGKLVADPWPPGAEPKGFGRGVLASDRVYWPTRTAIHVLSQRTAQQLRQPIELSTRGLHGGNLMVANGMLLVVNSDEIVAFDLQGSTRPKIASPSQP